MSFFLLLITKEDILKNTGNQSSWAPLIIFFFIVWMSLGSINCLVTHILQNMFFAQQKKEIHTGLEQLKGD